MTFEVEQKFAVDNLEPIRQRLTNLHAQWLPAVAQNDTYFAHPQRDFAQTDEALRLRHTDDGMVLTYKGPRIDSTLKTRREIEVPLPPDHATANNLADVLLALGFRTVAEVRKLRTEAVVQHQEVAIHVALDEVERLGAFVEVELLTEEGEAQSAGQRVASLATALGLKHPDRRSYLEMLLKG